MLLNEMESLLIDVDHRTKHIDERVTAIDARVEAIDERVRNIDARTSRIEQILPILGADIARLDSKVDARFDDATSRALALHEELRSSINLVAEHLTTIYDQLNRDRS